MTYTPENWHIDPFDITRFDRTRDDLEVFYLFAAAVAGKKATVIAAKICEFLAGCGHPGSPFERVRCMLAEGSLDHHLRRVKLGKYKLLANSYTAAAIDPTLDLASVAPESLETYPGFGKKSSRFLIVHSRPDVLAAVIDTHILKYLRAIGISRVPDTIPIGKEYMRLEQIVLAEALRNNMKPHAFDLAIWSWYSSKKSGMPDFYSTQSSAA